MAIQYNATYQYDDSNNTYDGSRSIAISADANSATFSLPLPYRQRIDETNISVLSEVVGMSASDDSASISTSQDKPSANTE